MASFYFSEVAFAVAIEDRNIIFHLLVPDLLHLVEWDGVINVVVVVVLVVDRVDEKEDVESGESRNFSVDDVLLRRRDRFGRSHLPAVSGRFAVSQLVDDEFSRLAGSNFADSAAPATTSTADSARN